MRETVAGLRRKCEELGTRRLICFGQSSGGYAAILYGLKLKADGVLAFSPVILPVMEPRSLDRIEAAKGRRLNRRDVNLHRTLARSREAPPITIVYGDRNETDARSARHLAGLPGVAEHPLAGVEVHGTVETTSRSGEFPMIFSALCDEIGQGRWLKRSRKGGRQSRERRGRARPRSPGVDR